MPARGHLAGLDVCPSPLRGDPACLDTCPRPLRGDPASLETCPRPLRGNHACFDTCPGSPRAYPASLDVCPRPPRGDPVDLGRRDRCVVLKRRSDPLPRIAPTPLGAATTAEADPGPTGHHDRHSDRSPHRDDTSPLYATPRWQSSDPPGCARHPDRREDLGLEMGDHLEDRPGDPVASLDPGGLEALLDTIHGRAIPVNGRGPCANMASVWHGDLLVRQGPAGAGLCPAGPFSSDATADARPRIRLSATLSEIAQLELRRVEKRLGKAARRWARVPTPRHTRTDAALSALRHLEGAEDPRICHPEEALSSSRGQGAANQWLCVCLVP